MRTQNVTDDVTAFDITLAAPPPAIPFPVPNLILPLTFPLTLVILALDLTLTLTPTRTLTEPIPPLTRKLTITFIAICPRMRAHRIFRWRGDHLIRHSCLQTLDRKS